MMNARFTLTPSSAQFIVNLAKSSQNWPVIADRATKRVAEACARDVKTKIESQAFPNARVTDAWLARKVREGLDTRTLIATQAYYKSIRAQKVTQGVWGVVCNDLLLRQRLEEGTKRGNPPRPHWKPVLDDYQTNFVRHFATEVITELFGGSR